MIINVAQCHENEISLKDKISLEHKPKGLDFQHKASGDLSVQASLAQSFVPLISNYRYTKSHKWMAITFTSEHRNTQRDQPLAYRGPILRFLQFNKGNEKCKKASPLHPPRSIHGIEDTSYGTSSVSCYKEKQLWCFLLASPFTTDNDLMQDQTTFGPIRCCYLQIAVLITMKINIIYICCHG